MSLTLFTSGSTKEPKEVRHSWDFVYYCADRAIDEIKLTSKDRVLNVFPGNTIAHYTITSLPALRSGADLVTANFDPYSYMKLVEKYKPTYISLIPRHWEILRNTKGWENLDLSSVRYMVTGSQSVLQSMIDEFRSRGVGIVANWYGMTEMPPPVFIGYNSEAFEFDPKPGYSIEFTDEGECVINGHYTEDIFDLQSKKFLRRKNAANGNTWKTSN